MAKTIIKNTMIDPSLCEDKPVIIWINHKPYTLCTDEYFEKQMRDSQAESEGKNDNTQSGEQIPQDL